jgi:cytochrome c oxidase assembly factor CtaG
MTWWCSARDSAWTWEWQAYPGVWLFVAAIVVAYVAAVRAATRGHVLRFGLGALVLWIAADWPLGALGAGYLASIHTLQYLLFTLVAPPLLLSGVPAATMRRMMRGRWAMGAGRALSRPLVAFAIFNVVMLGTHLPVVVDTLTASQLGSFAMDVMWLFSGIVFWLPILAPLEELDPLPIPGRLVYLVANVFLPTVPASFLTFADYPLYAVYELAPPIGSLSATVDQQIAGLTMKVGGGTIIFGTASVLFFRWYRQEETADAT